MHTVVRCYTETAKSKLSGSVYMGLQRQFYSDVLDSPWQGTGCLSLPSFTDDQVLLKEAWTKGLENQCATVSAEATEKRNLAWLLTFVHRPTLTRTVQHWAEPTVVS